MTGRRRARSRGAAVVVLATALATAACNALTGAPDRVLDDADASPARPRDDASVPDVVDEDPPLTMVDGGDGGGPSVVFIDVPPPFKGLNGATFTSNATGTTVTAYDGGGANHAVLVPLKQPLITADDYTVYATVRAPMNGEFGILTRMQPDGSGFGIGSRGHGAGNKQFLGLFGPPEWAPSNASQVGTAYVYVPNGRYKFELKAVGNQVSGKMWEAGEPEPTSYQLIAITPWSTGRGVGYYDYVLSGGVLESLRVSIP